MKPADVYLDYCPEVDRFDAVDLNVWETGDACQGCPIGGGPDCPGIWRWRSNDRQLKQASPVHPGSEQKGG